MITNGNEDLYQYKVSNYICNDYEKAIHICIQEKDKDNNGDLIEKQNIGTLVNSWHGF